jgi:DNA polymerase-1
MTTTTDDQQKIILLDGDIYLYESTTTTERAVDYGNDVWILSANLAEAKDNFQRMVGNIQEAVGTKDMIVCLSDSHNFRKDLTDTYKSQRKATRKPLIYPEMRKWVMETYSAVVYPRLEADDVLGILSTTPQATQTRIIVSTDKDMQTVPGWLYRDGEVRHVSLEEADRYWLTQTLTGDPTDGYKGCPGVGAVGAQKVLGSKADYGSVELAYMKAGLTKDDALLNARLARILRWSDWDHEKQEVKLWSPGNDQ